MLCLGMPQAALFLNFNSSTNKHSIVNHAYTPLHLLLLHISLLPNTRQSTCFTSIFTFFISPPSTMTSPTLLSRKRNPYGLHLVDRARGRCCLWYEGLFKFALFSLILSTLPFRRRNPYRLLLWFIPVGYLMFFLADLIFFIIFYV